MGRIAFVALLVAVSASPARATGDAPLVIDSQGAVVGTVLGEASDPDANLGPVTEGEGLLWVAHPIPGADVRLLVGESGPWDTKGLEPLLYESEDCTGTPLLEAPADADGVRRAVVFATDVFWPDGPGASRVIHSRATLVRDQDDCAATPVAPQVCCTRLANGETRTVAPVTGVALASLRLSPPFRIDAPR